MTDHNMEGERKVGEHANEGVLPAGKRLALSRAADELLHSASPKLAIQSLVRSVHDLRQAESSAVFIVPEDSPDHLALTAGYSDLAGHEYSMILLPIQSWPGGGLTGHIAATGEVTRLHGADLLDHPYSA